jgi:hypothetical protein
MNRQQFIALLGILLVASTTNAQQAPIELEITTATDVDFLIVCVPLSLPKKIAEMKDMSVPYEIMQEKKGFAGPREALGQLTSPGLFTDHIPPAGDDLVRRDLHFHIQAAMKAGTVVKATIQKRPSFLVGTGYSWNSKKGEYTEVTVGLGIGAPIWRYLHSPFDNSTPEKHDQTCKVSYGLYNMMPSKGPYMGPPPAHSVNFAFNKITLNDGRECDIWNGKPDDTHQAHTGFAATEINRFVARQRATIDWHGPKNEVFAKEEREITSYYLGRRGIMMDIVSRVKTTDDGVVKLRGDPQSAGFQFRPHDSVKESEKQILFIRPDGKGTPGEARNEKPKDKKAPQTPWEASSYILGKSRFTAAVLAHPGNPAEARWSESTSGQLGNSFEWDLTKKAPLTVAYRVWLGNGEVTVERIDTLSKAFRELPKVTIKYPAKDTPK